MDFTKFDIVLLTTMSLAVVLMSMIFPALGMTDDGDSVNGSEIPEYNTTGEQFDMAGDFPDTSETRRSGTLKFDQSRAANPNSIDGVTLHWIDRPTASGTSVEVQNLSNQFEFVFNEWDSDSVTADDRYEITNEGQEIIHENESWTIVATVDNITNYRQPNMTAEVSYSVESMPDDSNGPFEFSGLGDVAQVLGYFAQVITWFVLFIVDVGISLVLSLFNTVTYFVSMGHWLLSTYFSVISGAPSGIATAILTIPGVLLGAEFAKLIMIAISLLPTT